MQQELERRLKELEKETTMNKSNNVPSIGRAETAQTTAHYKIKRRKQMKMDWESNIILVVEETFYTEDIHDMLYDLRDLQDYYPVDYHDPFESWYDNEF